jgi:uncharacterized protein (TIGR02145 family)
MNKTLLFLLMAFFAAFAVSCFDSDEDEDLPGNNLTGGNDSSSSDGTEVSSSSASVVYDDSVDYGGEIYQTVVIGAQTWFSRNLNYEAEGSRCYNDLDSNCEIYGRLYDWETALAVCPSGWHLPSEEEWVELIRFVEDDVGAEHDAYNRHTSQIVGMYLRGKEWRDGSDNYGFSAILGGWFWEGRFGSGMARWWSASEKKNNYADCWVIMYNIVDSCLIVLNGENDVELVEGGDKSNLLSVRCLKD